VKPGRSPRRAIVLGASFAAARRAEERHRAAMPGVPSPLANVDYSREAGHHDLFRLVETDVDAQIRAFLEQFGCLTARGRTDVRNALRLEDFYTLLTFVQRSVLACLRTRDRGTALAAATALSAIDAERVDLRDLDSAAAMLSWVLSFARIDAADAFAEAASRSEPRTERVLARLAAEPVTTLAGQIVRYVETRHGPGLVTKRFKRYEPSIDLVDAAMAIVAVFEEDVYHVESVTICEDLPSVWLKNAPEEATRPALDSVRACLTLHAVLRRSAPGWLDRQSFFAFLLEAETPDDARVLGAATDGARTSAHTVLGVSCGALACVVVAGFGGGSSPYEAHGALERFRAPIEAALRPYAPQP
jgi:hypothetical protein